MKNSFSSEVPSAFPTIIIDRTYGAVVDNFDINLSGLTEHLRAKGLSDEEITHLTIEFTGDDGITEHGRYITREQGAYTKGSNKIEVNQPTDFFTYTAPYTHDPKRTAVVSSDARVSFRVTKTVVHEVEHYIQDFDEELQHEVDELSEKSKKLFLKRQTRKGRAAIIAIGVMNFVAWSSFNLVHANEELSEKGIDDPISLGIIVGGVAMSGIIIANYIRGLKRDIYHTRGRFYEESPAELGARDAAYSYNGEQLVKFTAKRQQANSMLEAMNISLNRLNGEIFLETE